MEIIMGAISFIIRLIPIVLLIMFIVSLVFFFKSPKGSQKRTVWMILAIVFGVIIGLIVAVYAAILIIMMMFIEHM